MKKFIVVGIIVVALLAVFACFYPVHAPTKNVTDVLKIVTTTPASIKNVTYIIDGQSITLVNGLAESEAAPGSAEKQTTKYFGNEATGDLNGDGKADVAFLLTQNNGGSGTFYYVVVALKTDNGYQGINAILLGDRVAPQTTEIKDGQVIVNYADRKADESFAVQPSVGVSKYLKIVNGELVEVK